MNEYLSFCEKLEIIQLAEKTSIHFASDRTGKDRKTIRSWISNKQNFLEVPNKKIMTLNKGRKPKTLHLEPEILDFIHFNRKLGNPIDSFAVIIKLIQLDSSYQEKKLKTLQAWCYRFLQRNLLTFRRGTHIGQSLPEDYLIKIQGFLRFILRARNNHTYDLN